MGAQINIRFMPKLNGEGTNLQTCGLRARTGRIAKTLEFCTCLELECSSGTAQSRENPDLQRRSVMLVSQAVDIFMDYQKVNTGEKNNQKL
jgi:hypothetical protein